MRPERFHEFAATALAAAPEVAGVETWDGRRIGLAVTFTSGSRVWVGITGALPPGVKHEDTDTPVTGEVPVQIPWPELYDQEKATTPAQVCAYLATALTNSGNDEIQAAASYGDHVQHPGFGATFHSEAKVFCLLVHTERSGRSREPEYQLQENF
ncbi:hypothetical protein [Streptomyces sp. NPDC051567]|uniref:hypothetical protein n=1 Tax=Streptomyces sp. NPDC051567 TaxID=3365660 RepID=UPI00378F3809